MDFTPVECLTTKKNGRHRKIAVGWETCQPGASLEERRGETYDGRMTLDAVLKAVRRVFQKTSATEQQSNKSASPATLTQDAEDDESLDPFDPFPEMVVVEFRDVLDLHSIPPKQVPAVVEGYLEEAHERGTPFVRIIHGKGIGVQRDIVRGILARTPFVMEYKDAPVEAGGWGATIVTLNARQKS